MQSFDTAFQEKETYKRWPLQAKISQNLNSCSRRGKSCSWKQWSAKLFYCFRSPVQV